jgi:hypothetical protein
MGGDQIDEIGEIARTANSMAQQTLAQGTVNGVLLHQLIDALLANGTISQAEIQSTFDRTAALINREVPPAQRGSQLHQLMVTILRGMAAGHKVRLKD